MKTPALLFALISGLAAAQSPVLLRSGQAVTLHGTLHMEPQGRLQFVAVKTKEAYVPMLDSNRKGEVLHEIAFSGYHRYDLLYAHREQTVTVTGKMMIDAASPYYYKKASLLASSIRLQDGTELVGEARSQAIAADMGVVHVTITLPADLAAPWTYEGPAFNDAQRPAACSSNGGGDVVNCYCPLNFHATEAVMTTEGKQQAGALMGQMAQFAVGDEARAAQLKLSCTR